MIEKHIELTTKHGKMPSFIAHPETGPCPAIIFYMDAPGMREELEMMAKRIARQGYYVIVPDLYYRLGRLRFDTHRRDEGMSIVIKTLRQSLTNALIMDDTAAVLGFLDGQDAVKTGMVGCVGYCMSGQWVVAAAGHFPHRIAAAVSLYGLGIVTDKQDSPHLLADQIKAELYLGFAEHDPVVPPSVIPALRSALEKAGTKFEIEQFSGTHHGFCFIEREAYDTFAAETAWKKMFALYARSFG